MICDIVHRFEYRFSGPVFLEPHSLYLMPRSDGSQKVKHFELRLDPEPSLMTSVTDPLGNTVYEVWFKNSTTGKLSIEAVSRIETLRQNPFDYLLKGASAHLPMRYSQPWGSALRLYQNEPADMKKIKQYADETAHRAKHETMGFLSELCLRINRDISRFRRNENESWPMAKVLTEKKGNSRDLAMLFIACCQSQGLAARFTSGYAENAMPLGKHEIHGWAEVYLEGGGWRGYDPSTGLAVSDQHAALASAQDFQLIMPVNGTFRSNGAKAVMHSEVSLFFDEASALPASGFRRLHQTGDTVRS